MYFIPIYEGEEAHLHGDGGAGVERVKERDKTERDEAQHSVWGLRGRNLAHVVSSLRCPWGGGTRPAKRLSRRNRR